MRHIALLSVLCISVSATALAAPQQDLKARLAAARMEAQGDNTGTLVLPPETGPVKAEPKKVTAPAIAAQQPLPHPVTDLDLMPKPGATIPLASSNNNAAPVITPVTPPVAASQPKAKTVMPIAPTPQAAEKVSAPAPAIAWNEPQSVKPAPVVQAIAPAPTPIETQAPTPVPTLAPAPAIIAAAPAVKTEAIIPTAKLQPVVLPSVITPLQPVKAAPVQAAPVVTAAPPVIAPAPAAKAEEIKAPTETVVAKAVVADKPQTDIVTTSVKTDVKPVAAPDVKVEKKKADAPKPVAKALEKPVQQAKAAPVVPVAPEFLPMPQAMPAMKPKMVDATQVNVTREAGVPAVPVIPVTAKRTIPQVPASIPTGAWSTRMVGTISEKDKDAAFCLMENKFDNRASLMIGQRADGYSTIGINYGIDMLDIGRSYSTLVLIDDSFEESFNGYAESGNMLIIQLGKKPSFFAMLANAQHLRIMLPGVASNFATQGIGSALQEFETCLASIGGELQTDVPSAPLSKGQNMPVVSTDAVHSNELTPPGASTTIPEMVSVKPKAKASGWSGYVADILNQAGIRPKNIQQTAGVTEWTDISGMHGQVWQVPGTDILEAAMTQLDEAEKECGGEFTNQIGAPESIDNQSVQMMESKCASAQGVSVSTWLVQQNPSGITAWEMRAPQAQNASTFDARQKILTAIQSQPRS